MNRYILVRRLAGPAFLLLTGVNAMLNQAHILSWQQSWPFYLILIGVLKLAERAAFHADGYPQWPGQAPQAGWPAQPGWPPQPGQYPAAPAPAGAQPTAAPAQPSAPLSAIVPSIPVEIVKKSEGGEQ